MTITFIGTSCGNKQQKSASEATTEQSASSALEIDSLLANAETLQGKKLPLKAFAHIPANMVQRKSS